LRNLGTKIKNQNRIVHSFAQATLNQRGS